MLSKLIPLLGSKVLSEKGMVPVAHSTSWCVRFVLVRVLTRNT